ncbi:dihydroxyacetone kinase subunit L [Microbacterium sp. LRZ72]|uniref:DAK2 domain-containing protein n=1 Tax=Microbacterium sp. LRZ72 TaxID=2942481 RepID=UPI0029A6C9A4|nr:DAK2 domain-containing protein [Microbacterium sp. LRZ72]MDX2376572.1 dihydroxyacetone kinase subunit L [Microbacterium sp. LRZ72]
MIDGTGALTWVSAFETQVRAEGATIAAMGERLGYPGLDTRLGEVFSSGRSFTPPRESATFHDVFTALARSFVETDSLAGAAFGILFHALAREVRDDEAANTATLASSVRTAEKTISRRTGARLGDKTLLDALAPTGARLADAAAAGVRAVPALAVAGDAAREGARATEALPPRFAAAPAPLDADGGLGVADPGAVVVALFFEAGGAMHTRAPTPGR